jgi:predicted  nucleic acid-binding Zn-ribbon protein
MSKQLHYANIPIGYVCVPAEEYADLCRNSSLFGKQNIEQAKKITDLEAQLETAEADRDSSRNAVSYWAGEYNKLRAENDALKAKNESLRETVSFYVPKWEEDEESCRT